MRSISKIAWSLLLIVLFGAAMPCVADPVFSTYTTTNGYLLTVAYGINDSGNAAGYSSIGSSYYGFYLPEGGSQTTLFVPGSQLTFGGGTFGTGINNANQVVGYYTANTNVNQGFVYNATTQTYTSGINIAGATNTFLYGINNSNEVVGSFVAGGQTHGFIETDPTLASPTETQLDVPGALATYAYSVNDNGEVVGSYVTAAGNINGFTWSASDGYSTFSYDGALDTYAMGINNNGNIVGTADGAINVTSFVGTPGDFTAYTGLSTGLGDEIVYLSGINNEGQVSGHITLGGLSGAGAGGDYALFGSGIPNPGPVPIPEPGAGLLMASGGAVLAGLGLLRRRFKA
jgi:hypothetical protein